MKALFGIILLALGLLVGVVVGRLIPAARAAGNPSIVQTMSPHETPMMEVMEQMHAAMHAVHVTGNTDADFMMMMVPHHRAGIEMAEIELQYGSNPRVKKLAEAITSSERKELSLMTAWLIMYGIKPK